MLKKYAQEISEYLSAMMGRSIIITDINGIIIGSPARERIGEFHPPSIPCIKYKKMSFDDKENAQKLGVWYPGSTFPLFYQNEVIGTAAVAGEPTIVLQFSTLVKHQIESLLREKMLSLSTRFSQREVNALVEYIAKFNALNTSITRLINKAQKLGFKLNVPRGVIIISFSKFNEQRLEKNPEKLISEHDNDPISEEFDYIFTHRRIIELIREIFIDPQTIIASIACDKLCVIYTTERHMQDGITTVPDNVIKSAWEIYNNLKENSIQTKIGLSSVAFNAHEIPGCYNKALEIISIVETNKFLPGVYLSDQLLLEEIAYNIPKHNVIQLIEQKFAKLIVDDSKEELIKTFKVYCESLFNKQSASRILHLHRNTLSYRLKRIEDIFEISMDDFKTVVAHYLILYQMELNKKQL